jgi:hypothetical protein
VQLQTWELNANLYDGASTAGPVPTIFSDDQQATIDALVGDPAQAHKDVVRSTGSLENAYTQQQLFPQIFIQLHNTIFPFSPLLLTVSS